MCAYVYNKPTYPVNIETRIVALYAVHYVLPMHLVMAYCAHL